MRSDNKPNPNSPRPNNPNPSRPNSPSAPIPKQDPGRSLPRVPVTPPTKK